MELRWCNSTMGQSKKYTDLRSKIIYVTEQEYREKSVIERKAYAYAAFMLMKEKKIKDHLGNAFETEKKMCEFYQISYKTYNARKRYGWDLKKILTTKTRDYNYKND